jgi:NAD(P)-dependent dehydrogenase (short-subunit alcohol dehydrogenase family)
MRLRNKACLITGAGSGIGREGALLFAREGAWVACVDLRSDTAEKVAEEIRGAGGTACAIAADVARRAAAERMVRTAERELGGLHVLWNNAGIFPAADNTPEDTPETVWDEVMRVNLKGVFLGCKYGIPALRRAGGGSIVNTASFVALLGAATSQVAYTASKGGVLSLTREIAAITRRNIAATPLPGSVDTVAELPRSRACAAWCTSCRLARAEEIARRLVPGERRPRM